ncbi:class I SAM-dependent methyltransferase [Campylobacter insulaenigrae]|uniref:Methyltransferase n=1 Tax=Campylobacter insulaenigrae NCTC 12927 TaxID=1031564 RepID=A0A0A8H310_9BACT|nr:class I SAM-dependent methyltransferase [Campylobacter insulaenigrae]AJC87299.1 methyltransferase [Campylobacter insulaenigrae NCTC 12927]VEH93156.1 SAM-dependent methlyltransferase [Campylobacter insulaenigrae]
MLDYIVRKKCAVGCSEKLEILSKVKFPVFCGCVLDDRELDLIAEEEVVISQDGVVQLKKLIPLEILYASGHDSGATGLIWNQHHEEFSKFILNFEPKNVLEIGGGHGKLAKHCLENSDINWTIMEPNPTHKNPKVQYIESFFNATDLKHGVYDTIIHSHTLEHIYDPHNFLSEICTLLNGGGYMIFSIPNLKEYLKNKWINCISFEHSILMTEKIVEFLLLKNKFKIKYKKYFLKHSIFYCVEKDQNISSNGVYLYNEYKENKRMFLSMKQYYQNKISELNVIFQQNANKTMYLFGAHTFSQYLIYNGLYIKNIKNILDNNKNKWNKRLYGTELFVKDPQIIKNDNNVLVILNCGIYNDEIEIDILKICNCEIIKI